MFHVLEDDQIASPRHVSDILLHDIEGGLLLCEYTTEIYSDHIELVMPFQVFGYEGAPELLLPRDEQPTSLIF